ncbi:MAG TPA: DUF882 domain-containing protein [Geminicoccaceae bacterium]|nr:DUF882 domain-containing protein [Geminicoccaceae bacterium]
MPENMPDQQAESLPSRRGFLQGLAASALAAGLAGLPALPAEAALPVRQLSFHHLHTGEKLQKAVYFARGRYVEENLRLISRLLRDWRTGEVKPVDPKLLDVLFALQSRLRTSQPFAVVCGYRSPKTNAMLRRQGHGVARNSLHLRAMAIDLKLPGRSLKEVRNAAVQAKLGGVGYYPASGFVHVDTGPVRYW